jgi:hypothetical protein
MTSEIWTSTLWRCIGAFKVHKITYMHIQHRLNIAGKDFRASCYKVSTVHKHATTILLQFSRWQLFLHSYAWVAGVFTHSVCRTHRACQTKVLCKARKRIKTNLETFDWYLEISATRIGFRAPSALITVGSGRAQVLYWLLRAFAKEGGLKWAFSKTSSPQFGLRPGPWP